VKLFEYPCVEKNSQYKDYGGHSSHVMNVIFCKENRFAVSVGGGDRTIIQWKFSPQGLR
jgi:WD40 repeat protein